MLAGLPDDELMAQLTAISGIGPWTVQGAMLIALGREDVVLPGDLALRKAVHAAYQLDHLPTQQGGPRHRREMAALPQPGDQLSVLRRLRAGRSITGRPAREHWNMNGGTHLDPIHHAHRSRLGPTSCGNHVT